MTFQMGHVPKQTDREKRFRSQEDGDDYNSASGWGDLSVSSSFASTSSSDSEMDKDQNMDN